MPRFALTLVLSEEQERQLEQWLAALGTPQQVALRCRIVLACAAGKPEIAIAGRESRKSQNRSLMARAVQDPRLTGALGDCSGSGAEGHLRANEDQVGNRCHFAIQAEGEHSLELPHHGGGSGN